MRSLMLRGAVALGVWGAVAAVSVDASAGQTCTTGPFVMGVDVYDGTGSIDWTSAASAGVKFAVIKASQGTYDTDTQFATNWAASKAAGVVRAPYHFLDPTESGVDQANYFLNIVGTLGADDLPAVLDIECPVGNNEADSDGCLYPGKSGDATGAAITTIMNDWLTTVKAATGKTPIVYSFGSYFEGDSITTTGLQDYPLWIADPSGNECFDFPSPWSAATIWQYNQMGTIAGIGSGVDLDYFLGDMAALTAFATNGTLPSGSPGDGGVDAGAQCEVTTTGDVGVCIDTTACASMGGTSTPDFCPGAANIECCTGLPTTSVDAGTPSKDAGVAAKDAGTPVQGHDAGKGSGSKTDASVVHGNPPGSVKDGGAHGSAADGSDDQSEGSSGGCSLAGTSAPLLNATWLLPIAWIARRRRRA